MKIIRTLIIAAGLLAILVGAVHAETGNDLFQKALVKQTTEGNPAEAIKIYQTIVKKYGTDHKLAARALLQMAECYQKLGDAESQKVYLSVVREYADQKDAVALAQARLSGTAGASMKGDRPVWTGPNVDLYGRVSPDGRFISYIDWSKGRLMLHDIATNVDRALTAPGDNSLLQSVISRDGKQVVYEWWSKDSSGFRTAALQGNGLPEARQLFLAKAGDGVSSGFDLSADGKWIAATISHSDGTRQLTLIAVADGSPRVLKSLDSLPWGIFFSPDGKTIAYCSQGDLFVVPIDGGPEITVVHNANEVMGWTPDGRLLFSSDQTRSMGLWAQTIVNGKSQGDPELLKADIGWSVSSLGMTASGALYIYKMISTRDIVIAPLDLAAGKLLGPPEKFTRGFLELPRYPAWSPDGKYLAYPACDNECIGIRTVATGQVQQLQPALTDITKGPAWSPDGRSLLAGGKDASGGRNGFVRIDVQTGESRPLLSGNELTEITGASWSPDGRAILAGGKDVNGHSGFVRIDAQSGKAVPLLSDDESGMQARWSQDGKIKGYFNHGGMLVEQDLGSGEKRDVAEIGAGGLGTFSPDGKYSAVGRVDPSTNTPSLLLVSLAGGKPRELLRMTPADGPPATRLWTSDSSAVIFVKVTGSRQELWLVPVTGGSPRKLDIDPKLWIEGSEEGHGGDLTFSLSPDGSKLAFHMGKTVSEVWALENILPSPAAKK